MANSSKLNSSTFCPNPFNHLNIKQEGKVSACWRFPDRVGDYTKDSLASIWNDQELRSLRQSLLGGEKPKGCRSCWDLEASGCVSTRQTSLLTYPEVTLEKVSTEIFEDFSYPLDNLTSIEVRFDNICNLMCRHCSPEYSSAWERAVKKDSVLLDKMTQYGTFKRQTAQIKLTDETVEEIGNKLAPNLKEVLIAGGEPLYHEKHYRFLEKLLPYAENMRLSYNTNLSTLHYKDKSIVELWRNFKEIWIRVSLDGDPAIYPYVRVGGSIEKVEENIRTLNSRLAHADISATCTISLYNITRLISIIDYFVNLDVYFHASLVQYPEALNIKLLPSSIKKKITQDFNDWLSGDPLVRIKQVSVSVSAEKQLARVKKFAGNAIDYMNSEDLNCKWGDFLDYSKVLDRHHQTSLYEVYPEYRAT